MKKARLILIVIALFTVLAWSMAIKAKKFCANHFYGYTINSTGVPGCFATTILLSTSTVFPNGVTVLFATTTMPTSDPNTCRSRVIACACE